MTRKTLTALVLTLLLIGGASYLWFQKSEKDYLYRLNSIHTESDARQRLGSPGVIEPVPTTGLLAPPSDCLQKDIARVLVFHRGRLRESVLLYIGPDGRIACSDRRRFFMIGH
jgi:hypothetical protein